MPILPFLWIAPGMMPILHSPGVIIPGQLGPIRDTPLPSRILLTLSISSTGIPSVIQTITWIPASAASRIASAAKAAVSNCLLGVKRTLFTREPLTEHTGFVINQHTHGCSPLAAAIAFVAASVNPSAVIMSKSLDSSISLPCSTFVPSRRTMTGTDTCVVSIA